MNKPVLFDEVLRVSGDDPIEDYIVKKTYTVASISYPEQVWKHEARLVEQVQLTIHTSLGWYGDFGFEFIDLGQSNGVAPKLHSFDDSWEALAYLTPILDRLARGRSKPGQRHRGVSVAELVAALEANGFTPSEHNGKFDPVAFQKLSGESNAFEPVQKEERHLCTNCDGQGFIVDRGKASSKRQSSAKPKPAVKTKVAAKHGKLSLKQPTPVRRVTS